MPPKKKVKRQLVPQDGGGETSAAAAAAAGEEMLIEPLKYGIDKSIDKVVRLATDALDILENPNNPSGLQDLRAEIDKLECRESPVPCVGFLTKPNYGKSYLTNKLLTGDPKKGPCVHSERDGGGVTTIPVAFLSPKGQLAASRGGPDLQIGEESGVYAIDLEGALVEKEKFFAPLNKRDSPDAVYKRISDLTTENDPEKQLYKTKTEESEIEVGMYVVRYPFKNLSLPASRFAECMDPSKVLTCRNSSGEIARGRTDKLVTGAQPFSFIEVPGMETANDEKLRVRLHLALSFLDIILVGLEDKDWRLEKHFLEPLRECDWLAKVEHAEQLPSLVFCANADRSRSQRDSHDFVQAALTFCGQDSMKDPKNRSPLSNVYEVFRQGLNADLEDPRKEVPQKGEDASAQHQQNTHALNKISEITELWEMPHVDVATHLLSTLDTFVFSSAHWNSVLAAFARMTSEKAGQLLALRQRDWAEKARKIHQIVLKKIVKTPSGLQRNQVVAMKAAQKKLKQYIPDTDDVSRPATRFPKQEFGYRHKQPYQVNPKEDPGKTIRHPVGMRCDPDLTILKHWATDATGEVVGYRGLNKDDLSGLAGQKVENDLSSELVERLESTFDAYGKDSERSLIAQAVKFVGESLKLVWKEFAILHLEVCCRLLDSQAIFNKFVKDSNKSNKKGQLLKAHVVLDDYVENIKMMLTDGKYKDYTIVPSGLTKLEPYRKHFIAVLQRKGADYMKQYIARKNANEAVSSADDAVYPDELPDELTKMIDELGRHCRSACEQFNPLDIPAALDEDEKEESESEPEPDSGGKRKRSSTKGKQKGATLAGRAKLFEISQQLDPSTELVANLDQAMAKPRNDGGDIMAHPGMSTKPSDIAKVDGFHQLWHSTRSLQFPARSANLKTDDDRLDLEECLDKGLLRRSGDRIAKMRQTREASVLAKYCGALSKLSVVEDIIEPIAEQDNDDAAVDVQLTPDDNEDGGGTVTIKYTQYTKDKIKKAVEKCIEKASEPVMTGIYPVFVPSKDRSVTQGLRHEDQYVFPGHEQCNMIVETLFEEDTEDLLEYFAFLVVEKQELETYKKFRSKGLQDRKRSVECKKKCHTNLQFITIPGKEHERLLGIGRIRTIIMLLAEHWGLQRYFQVDDDLTVGKEVKEFDFTKGVKRIVDSKLARGFINLQMVLRREIYPSTRDLDPALQTQLQAEPFTEPRNQLIVGTTMRDDQTTVEHHTVDLVQVRAMELRKLKDGGEYYSEFSRALTEMVQADDPPTPDMPMPDQNQIMDPTYQQTYQQAVMDWNQESQRGRDAVRKEANDFTIKIVSSLNNDTTLENYARDPTALISCLSKAAKRRTDGDALDMVMARLQAYPFTASNGVISQVAMMKYTSGKQQDNKSRLQELEPHTYKLSAARDSVVLFNLDAVRHVHPMADVDLFSFGKPLSEGGLGMSKAEQQYYKMACGLQSGKKKATDTGDDPLPSKRKSTEAAQQTFHLLVQSGSYGEDYGLIRSLAQRNITGIQVFNVMACYNDDDPSKARAIQTKKTQMGGNANSLVTHAGAEATVHVDDQLIEWGRDSFEKEVRKRWQNREQEWVTSAEFRQDWHKVWLGYADSKARPELHEEEDDDAVAMDVDDDE